MANKPKGISSYQKLKAEISALKNDIYNLVAKENEEVGISTKLKYTIGFDLDALCAMGSLSDFAPRGTFENKRLIETPLKNRYALSVTEEYFYQCYPNWSLKTGPERMDIRNRFLLEVEQFAQGKSIATMSFIDQHVQLRQCVTIVPII
jgi:hypothetical protein